MLAASMSALVGGAVLSTSACSSATPEKSPPAMPENALITLGVRAGPPPVPNKAGISSALKIGGDVYQIDCGLGSLNAFTNAGLRFDDLKSMFITHLHSDHIVDSENWPRSPRSQCRRGRTTETGRRSPSRSPSCRTTT